MALSGAHLVGGGEQRSPGATFAAVDPTSGSRLEPDFTEATADDVDRAVRAADDASEPYAALPAEARAAFLRAIAEAILALGDELLERTHAETGLPMARLSGERGRTLQQIAMFASLVEEGSWVEARIDRGDPARQPTPRPDLRRLLVPLGPVAVFGASNFPLAFSVAGGDTVSALAAGCPVVVKAHPAHPGASELVGRAIQQAARATQMPAGVFGLLQGAATGVGQALVAHPLIDAVGFTGSLRGGRALFDLCARRERPIPVYAEMGSSNPVFILPGALRERAQALARGLAASVTLGAGQFCTNPGLALLVDSPDSATFLQALAAELEAAPAGTVVHAGIKSSYESEVSSRSALSGVSVLARAGARGAHPSTEARAALLGATAGTFASQAELQAELYGPASLAVRCQDTSELYALARSLPGQLTATVHGTPEDLEQHAGLLVLLRRKAGRLIVNGLPTGVEVGPAMHHGGPYPATTDARATSVGTAAILRFARPVAFQDFPQPLLPPELQDANPRGIWRLVDGVPSREAL